MSVNISFTAQFDIAWPQPQHGQFETQLIAWHYRPAELRAVDAGEENELRFAIRQIGEHHHACGLRHRFDDENAGHHWRARKMPCKKRLVESDALNPDHALVCLILDYPIDQQKRITVRQDRLDLS